MGANSSQKVLNSGIQQSEKRKFHFCFLGLPCKQSDFPGITTGWQSHCAADLSNKNGNKNKNC